MYYYFIFSGKGEMKKNFFYDLKVYRNIAIYKYEPWVFRKQKILPKDKMR